MSCFRPFFFKLRDYGCTEPVSLCCFRMLDTADTATNFSRYSSTGQATWTKVQFFLNRLTIALWFFQCLARSQWGYLLRQMVQF